MFPSSKKTTDHFESCKAEYLALLQKLHQSFTSSSIPSKELAGQQIQNCIKDIQTANNLLTLNLPIKWLERELGAMIYDQKLQLTELEDQIWADIKNLTSTYSAGHGTGLGL